MARRSNRKNVAWYEDNRPRYASLANIIGATMRTLLQNEHIDVVDVTYRAKTIPSFAEKVRRKRYDNPQSEMTDLAGIRVVTLIERDIDRVSRLIQSSFHVHPDSSIDKSLDLGADRFGYRSVHFVCDIGGARETLPEFAPYAGLPFEIQVRTALQHAWAEIEHDRSYKFSGELPSKLKRRFHLIAGLLELADREFSSLTEELETYTAEVQAQADAGNLEIELNSTSATEFLRVALGKSLNAPHVATIRLDQKAILELRRFGVDSISKFTLLLNDEFLAAEKDIDTTAIGLVRDAMMYADVDRYFDRVWKGSWQGWEEDSYNLICAKHGDDKVNAILERLEIDIVPSGDFVESLFDDSLDISPD